MKKRLLCPLLPRPGVPVRLSPTEAHHAIRVLRLRNGEIVETIDGNGKMSTSILRIHGETILVEYLKLENTPRPSTSFPIILEMAVLKGQAMEWVVEKAVELGIKQLVPVLTAHTVVQMKSKGPESFRERWQKIADQALKQCGRLDRMEILMPCPLETLLSLPVPVRLWCDEKSFREAPHLYQWLKTVTPSSYSIVRLLIGPEGGWSEEERRLLTQETQSAHYVRIDLGPLVLRAETAAIFAMSLVSAHMNNSVATVEKAGRLV